MTFSFHPEAEEEFTAAIDYYEDCEAGLGYDFSLEVLTAIENIVAHPNAWPIMEENSSLSGESLPIWHPLRYREGRNLRPCSYASKETA